MADDNPVGDWVTFNNDGWMYEVKHVGLLTSRLMGFPDGRTVFIPNANIYGSVVSNHSKTSKMRLAMNMPVDSWINAEDLAYVRSEVSRFVAENSELLADNVVHVAEVLWFGTFAQSEIDFCCGATQF
jgi:small-conductance mechanosensitive channel